MSLYLTNGGASLVLATGGIPVLGSSPLARGEHPRLLFTEAQAPAQAALFSNGGALDDEFAGLVSHVESRWSSMVTPNSEDFFIHCQLALAAYFRNTVTLKGSWTKTPEEYQAKLNEVVDATTTTNYAPPTYLYGNEVIPIIFDLAYPNLSSGRRSSYIAYMYAEGTGDSLTDWLYTVSDREQISNSVTAAISSLAGLIGLTTLNTPECADQELAAFYESRWNWLHHYEKHSAYQVGGNTQNFYYYFGAYSAFPMFLGFMGYANAHGRSYTSLLGEVDARCLTYIPKQLLTGLRPSGPPATSDLGNSMRYWDSRRAGERFAGIATKAPAPWNLLYASVLNAGYDEDMAAAARWAAYNRTFKPQFNTIYGKWCGPLLGLARQGFATQSSPEALGWSLSHQDNCQVTCRTGWDADATYICIQSDKWDPWDDLAGWKQACNGSFELDRRGPLLTMGWTGVHESWKWQAGNRPVFVDSTLVALPEWGDGHTRGSQRVKRDNSYGSPPWPVNEEDWFASDGVNRLLTDQRVRLADPDTSRTVDYVGANYTRSYNSAAFHDDALPAHWPVNDYWRGVAFFRRTTSTGSDRIFVVDRVTKEDVKWHTRWLWEPAAINSLTLNGSLTANAPDRLGSDADGKRDTYTGCSAVEWCNEDFAGLNFQGRCFMTVLGLTSDVVVVDQYEDNYGTALTRSVPSEAYAYGYTGETLRRIEVINQSPSLTEGVVFVFEAADSTVQDVGEKSTTALVSSTGALWAARCATDVCVASNDSTVPLTSGTVTLPDIGASTWRVLLMDLPASTSRTVTTSHGSITVRDGTGSGPYTATSAGTLLFDVSVTAATTLTIS